MTHKTVGIHTDQNSDYGKDLEQKRDNGKFLCKRLLEKLRIVT